MKQSTSEFFGEMKPYIAEMIETAGGAGGGGTAGGGAVAAALLAAHVAEADPHTQYRLKTVDIPLTTDVTGVLPEANGGTNQSTYATGDMLYASAANTLSKRAIGSTNELLTVAGGVPTWAALTDAMHGDLGGGSLHDAATTSVAGFMSAADKTTLDALAVGTIGTGSARHLTVWNAAGTTLTYTTDLKMIDVGASVYTALSLPGKLVVGGLGAIAEPASGYPITDAYLQLSSATTTATSNQHIAYLNMSTLQTNTAAAVGVIGFANRSYVGGTDKRLVEIVAGTDGALDAGYISVYTRSTGGSVTERITITSTGNVEIDGDTVFIDATANRVGFRTILPQQPVDVIGTVQSRQYGAQGSIRVARGNGSEASPTKVLSGEHIGQIAFLGTYDTSGSFVAGADFLGTAAADWTTSTNVPTDLKLRVGSTSGLVERLRLTSTGSGLFGRTSGLTGAGDWDVDARCRADTFETAAGNKWKLLGWTTAADAVSNGYVQVTIDGTTYKLMTRA